MQPELRRIIENRPYGVDAYEFVMRSLDRTLQALQAPRHVSGHELVEGIRTTAREEFGPLAKHVLNEWGVFSTRDFGVIVFDLVAQGILAKTEEDDLGDFDECFEFDRAFETDYYLNHPAFTD